MQLLKILLTLVLTPVLGLAQAPSNHTTKFIIPEKKLSHYDPVIEIMPVLNKTQAYLGIKTDYEKTQGYYTGGKFIGVQSATVTADHFAHDALFQFEGPGWESDKVGYRLYLDQRNRTDIFGKKQPGLVLDKAGLTDLVSDGKESYQKMQDWGQDIFKVGSSLGIGSIAAYNDSVITVSQYDSLSCEVFNSAEVSEVKTTHFGWNTGTTKTVIKTSYSIKPGSRITRVQAVTDEYIKSMCTGIARHADTEYIKSDKKGWNYIALWGKQTIIGDNLGIVIFYNKNDLIKITEDSSSYIVVLQPDENKLNYYFAAAWEQEPGGIKTKDEFLKYLDSESEALDKTVQ